MKPEPLTKEKLQRCLELMAVVEEEVGEARKELNNIWFNLPKQPTEKDWKRFAEEVKQIVSPLFELLRLLGYSFELKERVDLLLKEIEKETNKYLDTYSHPDDEALRRILEAFSISITEKIKEAFSGVIEK